MFELIGDILIMRKLDNNFEFSVGKVIGNILLVTWENASKLDFLIGREMFRTMALEQVLLSHEEANDSKASYFENSIPMSGLCFDT